jgi:hypothetical protein
MTSLQALGAQVGARLKERGQTIAVAESSAGGLINAALVAVPGASAYYLGGGIIYTRAARDALLGITDAQMSGNLSVAAAVRYRTFNAEATMTLDFGPVSGTLEFAPGEAAKTITVPILEDSVYEGQESFYVFLDQPQNVLIRGTTAFVAIADDEAPSLFTVATASQSVAEKAGLVNVEIRRTGVLTQPAAVQYTMTIDTPPATDAHDFLATTGTIQFAPGEASKTLPVTILDDAIMEGVERFNVVLIQATGARLGDIRKDTITILDDDQAVLITSPRSSSVTEGGVASIEVRCSGLTSGTVTVDYADSTDTAVRGIDYEPVSGTLVFTPADTVKTIVVRTLQDSVAELREFVSIRLTPRDPVQLDYPFVGAAIEDDEIVQLTVSDVVVTEGDSGTRDAVFTVSLNAVFPEYLRFIAETEGVTATVGEDFLTSDQYVDLPRGTTSTTVRVPVRGDALAEGDETFFLRLVPTFLSHTQPVMTKAAGVCTIKDDDAGLSVQDSGVTEGDDGTRSATFTVRLSLPVTTTVTVNYRTSDGTAAAGSDSEHVHGTLTFAPGETAKPIAVPVHGDATAENDETFFLRIEDAHGAPITRARALGLIRNDDAFYTLHSDLEYAPGLVLDLYVPTSGRTPAPLIVWIGSRVLNPAVRETARGFAVASVDAARIEDAKAAVRWLRANAARFALDDERFIAWGTSLAALLGTTNAVASLEDPAQGNPAVSSAVQAAININGEPDATHVTPDDPPFLVTRLPDAADVDAATAFHQALLAAGVRSTLKIADRQDDEIDGFLDALIATPRRRSAGR